MKHRLLYLVAYDIADSGRLQKALGLVKAYATGGQKSVFECYLTATEKRALLADMSGVLNLQDDRFLLLPLTPFTSIHALGIAAPPQDPAYFYYG